MNDRQIFRKASLDRLASPEQLDTLTRVTSPAGWLALSTIGLLIFMALIWGWFGTIPVIVRGEGMLMNRGGVMNVVTLGSGQVTEIVVRNNDYVTNGQVVARIAQPVALNELNNSRNELEELRLQHQKLLKFSGNDLRYHHDSLLAQESSILHSIKSQEKRTEFVMSQLESLQSLQEKGIIIPAQVEEKRQELNSLNEQIETNRIKLADIKIQEHAYDNRSSDAIRQSEFKINALERRIALMDKRLGFDSKVVSKVAGKVVEIKTATGTVVSVGTPVISVELEEKKLEAVIYVPESDGKKIRSGMAIAIVPSSVKKEESGSVLGLVTSISEYPATYAGILTVLGNEQLAQNLLKQGTPYMVHAELIPDSSSHSGYKWSSGRGPAISIHSGTVCNGEIIVEKNRPLHLIIPYLKKSLGM